MCYSDNVPGLIGVVKHNINGNMIIAGDYIIRRKTLEKVPLNGKIFNLPVNSNGLCFFEGDSILLTRTELINLTAQETDIDLLELMTEKEQSDFNHGYSQVFFYGYCEKVKLFTNAIAARIRLTKSADGKPINKTVYIEVQEPSFELRSAYRDTWSNLSVLSIGVEMRLYFTRAFDHYRTHSIVYVGVDKCPKYVCRADAYVKRYC